MTVSHRPALRAATVAAVLNILAETQGFAADLSGTWIGNVTCRGQYVEPQPWPLTVNVIGSQGYYTVTASVPNGSGTGTISGTSITFTIATFLNAAHFTGTIDLNAHAMTGTYVQGMAAAPCSWFAQNSNPKAAAQTVINPPSQLIMRAETVDEVKRKMNYELYMWRLKARNVVLSPLTIDKNPYSNGPPEADFDEAREHMERYYQLKKKLDEMRATQNANH
jgi:hypothetical protein